MEEGSDALNVVKRDGQVNRDLVVRLVRSYLKQGNEGQAIATLRTYERPFERHLLVGTFLPEGDFLLSMGISNKCLTFVKFLCLEFIPENKTIHYQYPNNSTSILQAVEEGAEDIALFLHSLGCVNANLEMPPGQGVLQKAERQNMGQLLLALLRDPDVEIIDRDGYYLGTLLRILFRYENEWEHAIVQRLAGDINRKIWLYEYCYMEPAYFLVALVYRAKRAMLKRALDHPLICVRQLITEHLCDLTFSMCDLMHDHALMASTVLRLDHAQRKTALMCFQKPFQSAPTETVNMSRCEPQCVVPGNCPFGMHSGLSHDQLVRDATPERIGWIAYPLNRYGLAVLGLFLLHQDGYLAGNMGDKWKRYFYILQKLPLDMQMVMCRRLEGCVKDLYTADEVDGSVRVHLRWFALYAK